MIICAVDAIDASLLDLKGGTTGQVLAKASGTDMDFVWAADSAGAASLGYAAGKNAIINGAFNVWQRGTSFTLTTGSQYTSDRWDVGGAAGTVSRQSFTVGNTITGYESPYYLDWNLTSNSQNYEAKQKIEDVRTFAGQTATFSIWAKISAGTTTLAPRIYQDFGTGGSPSSGVATSLGTMTLTSSWQRFTWTISVPSISGKTLGTANNSSLWLSLQISNTATGTIQLWGGQAEAGSTATAFQTATGTLQGELAACQRYYQVIGGTINQPIYNAYNLANEFIQLPQNFPVQMRVTPTATKTGTWTVANCSQPSAVNPTVYGYALQTQKNGSSGVFYFYPDSSDDLITFSAEL